MSFIGKPVKSCPEYPKDVRVRQLLSSKQLESKTWIDFLAENDDREANGDEPLSYTYCSAGCCAVPLPKFTILVEEHE